MDATDHSVLRSFPLLPGCGQTNHEQLGHSDPLKPLEYLDLPELPLVPTRSSAHQLNDSSMLFLAPQKYIFFWSFLEESYQKNQKKSFIKGHKSIFAATLLIKTIENCSFFIYPQNGITDHSEQESLICKTLIAIAGIC